MEIGICLIFQVRSKYLSNAQPPLLLFSVANIVNRLLFFAIAIRINIIFSSYSIVALCSHLEVRTRLFANDSEETFHLLLIEMMLARKIQGGVTLKEHLVEVAK